MRYADMTDMGYGTIKGLKGPNDPNGHHLY
jgi:hypothetical protein